MQKKYLISAAVLGLALLTGSAALAQTAAPTALPSAAISAISATNDSAPASTTSEVLDQQDNNFARGGMMNRFNENNVGRGMMNGYAAPRNSRSGDRLAVGHLLAAAVTTVLAWAIMVLIIILLCFKVKKNIRECKAERNEIKK